MRYHRFLTLLFSLSFFTLSAQLETLSIPELHNLLKTLSAQDSSRAKTLLRLAELTRQEDFEQSMSYNQQAIEAARLANHHTLLCRALANGATNAIANSDNKEAARLIAEGLAVAETNNLPIQKAMMNRSLGSLYFQLGDIAHSEKQTALAMELAERLNIPRLKFMCYSDLAQVYLIANNLKESIRYAKLSINNSPPEQRNDVKVHNYITQAYAYNSLGKIDSIKSLLDSAKLIIAEGGIHEFDQWRVWTFEANYLTETKREPFAAVQLLTSKLKGSSPDSLGFFAFDY